MNVLASNGTFDSIDGPSIVVPPSDAEVLVGSTATFMCEASGNPPASISWSRDGVAVADDFVSNNGTVLTVDNVQPRDSVTYTCTSTNTVNDLGRWSSLSTNASAHLRVIGRQILLFKQEELSVYSASLLLSSTASADGYISCCRERSLRRVDMCGVWYSYTVSSLDEGQQGDRRVCRSTGDCGC